MKLTVIANEELKEEFLSKQIENSANVCIVNNPQNIPADTYIVFDLLFEYTNKRISLLKQFLPRPVFINAVTDTLAAIGEPFIRINAWPTFLARKMMEVAALPVLANTRSTLLFQLMQNLIGNALKYHGNEKPVIKIMN